MLREMLKTREILIGIIFFVMIVFGSGIYAWYVISSTNAPVPVTHLTESKSESTPTAVSIEKVDFDTSETQNDVTDGTTEHIPSTTDTQALVVTPEKVPIDTSDAVAVARDTPTNGSPPDIRGAQTFSDAGTEITPEEQEKRERRKWAEEIISAFMKEPAEIETPFSEFSPSLQAELKALGANSSAVGKFYREVPPEVREAARILQIDEAP